MRWVCGCHYGCPCPAACQCSKLCWGHGSCSLLPRGCECDIIARIAHLEEIERWLFIRRARLRAASRRRYLWESGSVLASPSSLLSQLALSLLVTFFQIGPRTPVISLLSSWRFSSWSASF